MSTLKKNKRMSRLLKALLVVFLVYTVISFINLRMDISNKQQELQNIQSEIEQKKLENDEISSILASGGEKEYIEDLAREKLGFLYPDEKVYINIFGN